MPEFVRRAIEAQGKVDPDEVEQLAAQIEADGGEFERPPIDLEQEALALEEEPRGYTYEP